jgi:hypothetical protein
MNETATKTSADLTWNLDQEEYYNLLTLNFDVREAKRIIAKKPRDIRPMALDGVKGMVARPYVDEHGVIHATIGHNVDWEKIDKDDEIDIDFPVIAALIKVKGEVMVWPIDGWHRIAKAVAKGLTSVPCVVLNQRETKKAAI